MAESLPQSQQQSYLIEEFINIWNNNSNMLSVQPPEFDIFLNIINKLRKKSGLNVQENKTFHELIEMMADTIWTLNNCDDTYERKSNQLFDEPELICCSELLNMLEENEIDWDYVWR